jgi:hypothetical protein
MMLSHGRINAKSPCWRHGLSEEFADSWQARLRFLYSAIAEIASQRQREALSG